MADEIPQLPQNGSYEPQSESSQAIVPNQQGVNLINPEGSLVSVPQEQLQDALSSGYQHATPEFVANFAKQQKYGTPGQQAITAVEGLAQGVAGPLATGLETEVLGVSPEAIRSREEVNPLISGGAEAAGFVGSALVGTGEAALLTKAGRAAEEALQLGKSGTKIAQVGSEAVKAAFEGALYQGGEELSRAFKEDPNQTAESAIADIGLASVASGIFGGTIGAALSKTPMAAEALEAPGAFVSQVDVPALEAGDFRATIANSNTLKSHEKESILAALTKEKADAKEIRAAGERLGAPVMEGMTSDSKLVQKAEDALINGVPTYSGLRRQALYNEGYNKASGALDGALGEGSKYSKAEMGNILKDSIAKDLEAQNAPIKAMYDELKQYHEVIPLSERSAPAISRNLAEIQELKLSPSSPEGQLIKRVLSEISNLKTVDDVKAYKSILNRSISPTASSGEKRMASIISDKLTNLEEASIERFARDQMKSPEAKARILDLIDQRKTANAKYKEFIDKVKTLSEQLGKGKVYGIQDALNFIRERLTPEEVANRLFSKRDSEFLKFFGKEFPEQAALMKEYQKGVLREAASRTGELSPKVLFNNLNKLEPEIQKAIFSPDELRRLKDVETYIRAMPKNFNPSGTSNMSAFREFFAHPTGAIVANIRDFGIERFIKTVGNNPQVKQAVMLAKATVDGERTANKAIKSIFSNLKENMPAAVIPIAAHREKLSKLVDSYTVNPDKMFATGDNNPVPEYNTAFAATTARAVQYLSSVRPDTSLKNPLDMKREPSNFEKSAYNRALDTANKPLSVLDRIKNNTLAPEDIVTLKSIYPTLYNGLSAKLMNSVMESVHKEKPIPYATRLQISMFTGQPLDSTMAPSGILAAQPKPQQQGGQQPSQGHKSSLRGMEKLPASYMTPEQSRAAHRLKQ